MTYADPTPAEQLAFLGNIQRLLTEGQYVASYKFALLIALAELAVERRNADGAPLAVPVTAIAEKFIELYWNHDLPYGLGVADGENRILFQNTGGQAEIVNTVRRLRRRGHHGIGLARRSSAWPSAVRRTARLLHEQPLWRLQKVGSGVLECLYRQDGPDVEAVRFVPGAAESLRHFHGLVLALAQGAWARFVQSLPRNAPILGQTSDLHSFLFGTERSGKLRQVVDVLTDVQHGQCLYCRKDVRAGEVDHFIPWSRYPRDLAHNLVLAHRSCNHAKRDMLAAERHLERWLARNDRHGDILLTAGEQAGLIADLPGTLSVTSWAYEDCERIGASVWLEGSSVERLGAAWRELLA
jgi:hypothetical protein